MAIFLPTTPSEGQGFLPGPPYCSYDKESSDGNFAMHVFSEDKFLPVLFRDNKKYASIRMAEISVLGEYLNLLQPELYSSVKIVAYHATEAEAKLLNLINKWHCDKLYGYEKFTKLDTIISLDDLTKFHDFLQFAFNVFHSGGKNIDSEFSQCGFVKINPGESLLPYGIMDGEIVLPEFYFCGHTNVLKDKVQMLGGWSLAYLKVCCHIQSVKMKFLAKPTLEVVTLTNIKAYFPKRTTFTGKCWPHPKPRSLFSKKILSKIVKTTFPQVKSKEWTAVEEYAN